MKFLLKLPDDDDFRRFIEMQKQGIFQAFKEAHILACMKAVNRAKMTDTYKDRTNNLRSSIGYVLYFKGEVVSEYFEAAGKGDGGGGKVSFTTSNGTKVSFSAASKDASGRVGVETGRSLAHEVAKKYKTDGFVSVIVAGMHYALYVEAMGYDVLTSSTLDFEKSLKQYTEIVKRGYNKVFRWDPPEA